MKKFLILVFTILIGLGLINKLYGNDPMYEDGAIEEYITYLEENLPTYVPKLLENPFNEGVFIYDSAFYNGEQPYQELKAWIKLTTGTVVTGKIRDLNDNLSEQTYDFYSVTHTYKLFDPFFKKMNANKNLWVLKSEWEDPAIEECTIFTGGPGEDNLINLVRQVARYILAFTIMPVYIIQCVVIILWGIIQL